MTLLSSRRAAVLVGPQGPIGPQGPPGQIGITGPTGAGFSRTSLSGPGSYTATAQVRHMITLTGGAMSLAAPDGSAVDTQFSVKIVAGNPATHALTVTTTGTIEQTLGQAG